VQIEEFARAWVTEFDTSFVTPIGEEERHNRWCPSNGHAIAQKPRAWAPSTRLVIEHNDARTVADRCCDTSIPGLRYRLQLTPVFVSMQGML
jgi:hypothetical protein